MVIRSSVLAFGLSGVVKDRSGIAANRPQDVVKSIPQKFRFAVAQQLAVDHDRPIGAGIEDFEQLQPELLGIGSPERMIAADQLPAAFDPAAGNEIVEADDPAADPVAGFKQDHVIAGRV